MNNRKLYNRGWVSSLAISSISLFLVGCNQANSEETNVVIKPVKLFEVPDFASNKADWFIAEIDATERAALSFQVSGEIRRVLVKMGQQVEKGQILAELDPTDYQLAVDARSAEYELAKTAYDRASALYEKQLISTDTYDQHESQFKVSKAALEQAKTDLAYTKIKAPFEGVISLSHVKEHQVIAASQPVVNLINNDVMDVVFSLPVSYVDKYGLAHISDAKLSVAMDINKAFSIPAKFKEISTRPDSEINSYRARVTIERPEFMNLFSGMTGHVQLPNNESPQGVTLVETAWISKTNGQGELFKFIPETQLIESVQVSLNDQGEVISGIESGDFIVETGVSQLTEGQQVKAWVKEAGI